MGYVSLSVSLSLPPIGMNTCIFNDKYKQRRIYFTFIHTYLNTHSYICTHIRTYVRTHMHYKHTYIHTHTYIRTYTHAYIQTYIHKYTHIRTYIRTYIHTHTCIHTSSKPSAYISSLCLRYFTLYAYILHHTVRLSTKSLIFSFILLFTYSILLLTTHPPSTAVLDCTCVQEASLDGYSFVRDENNSFFFIASALNSVSVKVGL